MAAMTTSFGTMSATQRKTEVQIARNRQLFEEQKRARRGPTPEVFFTVHIDNSRIVKADDPERRREMRVFSGVVGILFLLVMVYVCQHLSAIDTKLDIEVKKAEIEKLREQNRQYRLTEAQLSEPRRIDQIARQLGLGEPKPGQVIRTDGITGQEGTVSASIAAPSRTAE